jgi:Ni,Fe-hydrogenase I large subunit
MTTRIVGPFNRVEGDLEVQLDIADGRVARRASTPMYRGFEQMLPGDAAGCAGHRAAHLRHLLGVAVAAAARSAAPTPHGRDAAAQRPPGTINLMLACENLADHLTHFYLFFMPDFTRPVYRRPALVRRREARFKPVTGERGATCCRRGPNSCISWA